MLIIEGSDLVGKTTFAKKCLAELEKRNEGYIYRHFSRLPASFDYYWGYRRHASRFQVQDRFHMSEPVYSKVRDEDQSPLDPVTYSLVDGYLQSLGAFTVVITASDPKMIEARWGRDEMFTLDQVLKANHMFTYISNNHELHSYSMRVDATIRCTPDRPYPTDHDVMQAVKEYTLRQDRITAILRRKPDESL